MERGFSLDQSARRIIEQGKEAGDLHRANSVEGENGFVETHVVLEFMRHGKKEKTAPGQADFDVRLIPAARVAASEKGQAQGAQAEVAFVRGGRRRAQESATRVALGNRPEITPEMSLEEIEQMAQEYVMGKGMGKTKGKKVVYDPLLDFGDGKEYAYGLSEKAYVAGKMADFMVHDSDRVAIEGKDPTFTSYTVLAGNIAELTHRYLQVAKNFSNLLNKDSEKREAMREKYSEFGNQLERYFGTHIGIADSFLLKVVEKVEGVERREEILQALNGGAGSKELQGFKIDIDNFGKDKQMVRVKADLGEEKVDLVVTPELLEELITERNEFIDQFKKE